VHFVGLFLSSLLKMHVPKKKITHIVAHATEITSGCSPLNRIS